MSTPQIAAQVYTARDFCRGAAEYADTLAKIGRIGYAGVEICLFEGLKPADHARSAADAGLRIASAHRGWEQCVRDVDTVIAEQKSWNCPHVAIGGLSKEYFSVEGLNRFLKELPPVAEKLRAAGLDFNYHNHNHELARHGPNTWLGELYQRANPKHIRPEFDTYWIQAGGGDPAQWIARYGQGAPLLHLKDMAITPGRELRYAEVGEGNLNWPAILDAAREAGVEWYIVELDLCYERTPFESLKIAYDNLRAMLR